MIRLLARLGRLNTVVIITLIAAAASVAVTAAGVMLLDRYGFDIRMPVAIAFAAGVALVVAPPIFWVIVGLTLRIYRIEEDMRKLASYDSLTGLLSRHAFFEAAGSHGSLARREHSVFSVMLIDLDHFKAINDQYGHPAGDAVLRLFADVVNSVTRRSDIVGRLGGEEFALLLPSTDAAEAMEFSERLHGAIDKAVLKHDHALIHYTVSIGLATSGSNADDDIDELLARADLALYQAKRNGRNQTALFNPAGERKLAGQA